MEKLDPKIDGATPGIVQQNVEQLKGLFPEIVTEGKIDFDTLREVLGDYSDERDERYSFTWNGKSRARRLAQTPSTGTLRPCPEESVNWDTTQNLFIEGDNLEVLKLLQKSYHKKIKMIYIDPPYNTGKDFIYSDNFRDSIGNYLRVTGQVDEEGQQLSANPETSGRYHTDWLNMMYPRLKLARNLLRDDGAIFISADDCEVANLRKVCDEVFGEENFIATIIWHKMDSPKNSAMYLSEDHDYILLYSRSAEVWRPHLLPRTEEMVARYQNPDDDPRGPWLLSDLAARNFYGRGRYSITTPSGRVIDGPPAGSYWRVSQEKFEELGRDNRIWWGRSGDNRPGIKRFLSEVKDGVVPQTYWSWKDVGSTRNAKQELSRIMALGSSADLFITPKPTALIRRMLAIASDKDSIVLDFFAGSGSTGDAVVRENVHDGGNRRYILVQLPEPWESESHATIADQCRERLVRSGKLLEQDGQAQLELSTGRTSVDLGFRTLRLDTSNISAWDAEFENLEGALLASVENIKPDRSEVDVLYELLLKFGLDLSVSMEQRAIAGKAVYIIGAGALIVCLTDDIGLDVVEGIAALKEELKPEVMRVVFKDAGFADDVVKTNAVQILRQAGIDDVRSL